MNRLFFFEKTSRRVLAPVSFGDFTVFQVEAEGMLNNVVKKYVSEKLLLDIKRTKIREKKIQEGNEYRKNVKKIGKFRCFWVDDTIPVEMSESEGQKRPFKALDDESSESVSEIDWT